MEIDTKIHSNCSEWDNKVPDEEKEPEIVRKVRQVLREDNNENRDD